MKLYRMHSLLLDSFNWPNCSEVHPGCSACQSSSSFLLLGSISLQRTVTICSSIHLLMDVRTVSSLRLLQMKLQVFVYATDCNSLGQIASRGMTEGYGKVCLTF